MFGIGETELVIIVVFAFMLFGPDKLPGMGRTLGRVLRQFREASDGFTEVVQTNIMDPASEELEKSPKQRRREAAEGLAEGADVADDATQDAPAPKRETFAERKARLQAERKAAEEAAAAEAAAQEEPAGQGSDAATNGEAGDSATSSTSGEEAAEAAKNAPAMASAAEPARTSAQDLYATISQKSSRTRAKEEAALEAAQSADAAEPTSGEEAGSTEA